MVATRAIARGECVVFEAPVAAVKAGEPVASDALAAAFCGDATRKRDGLLGGVNSAGKGSPPRGGSQVEIPSMGAIIGEHAHACADDDVANGGVRCATPGLFPWGGGRTGGGEQDEATNDGVRRGRVPNEWLLTHQLLEARHQLLGGSDEEGRHDRTRMSMREWAGEYASKAPASEASERRRDEEVAAELAREIGSQDVTAEDVVAVHAAVCANAFALEAMCTRLNYGAGFFRAAAYVNHSCDPNCLSLRLGGNMAIFAARGRGGGRGADALVPAVAPAVAAERGEAAAAHVRLRVPEVRKLKRRGKRPKQPGPTTTRTETTRRNNDRNNPTTPIEIRTVALACGGDRPHDVLDAFRREVLEAPGAREALENCPPQAAVSFSNPCWTRTGARR